MENDIKNEVKELNPDDLKKNEIIINKSENKNEALKIYYIDNLNKILNNIKMDETSNTELRKLFTNLIDKIDNLEGQVSQLNGEVSQLNGKVSQLNWEVSQLNGEIIGLKKDIKKLNIQNEDIKGILGNIQCRDQSKSFLKQLNFYLTEGEKNTIFDYKMKKTKKLYEKIGAIIIKRFEITFVEQKEKENFKIIKELIKKVCVSLDKGDISIHSLTIDIYKRKMHNYKNQKQVIAIANSHIFSFLLGIGLNQDFYKTYSFLTEYFDKNLDLKSLNAPDFIKLHLDK